MFNAEWLIQAPCKLTDPSNSHEVQVDLSRDNGFYRVIQSALAVQNNPLITVQGNFIALVSSKTCKQNYEERNP